MLFARAPVAQLDRALVYETKGHRFESCRARHLKSTSYRDIIVEKDGQKSTFFNDFLMIIEFTITTSNTGQTHRPSQAPVS